MGSGRCSPEENVPVPQFPHLRAGQRPTRGGGRPRRCCSWGFPDPSRGSRVSPSCLLAQAQHTGLGPQPSGRGKPSPGGAGGQGWCKINECRNFFTVFRSYPRYQHRPSPLLSPQRSSSSGISANAFIRLHDAITRSSQKMQHISTLSSNFLSWVFSSTL